MTKGEIGLFFWGGGGRRDAVTKCKRTIKKNWRVGGVQR